MKKSLSLFAIFIFGGNLFANTLENPRETFWENALSITEEKPKTAISAFDDLIIRCAEANAWDEYVLAIILRAESLARIEGRNAPETILKSLKTAAQNAPSLEAKAFINARLARAYIAYAQNRAYGQMRAETTIDNRDYQKNKAIETWSYEELITEADEIYSRIFDDAEILKKIPLTPFLAKEVRSRSLAQLLSESISYNRHLGLLDLNDSAPAEFPTLYDFFAFDAIKFYTRHQPFSLPENSAPNTPLPPTAELFGNCEEFLSFSEKLKETSSPRSRQIKILGLWEKFHLNDADASALARAKLTRLLWAFENCEKTQECTEFYKTALKNFSKEFSYFPIIAEADAALAIQLISEDKNAEAHAIASQSYKKHQGKPNAKQLGNILDELETQSLQQTTCDYLWANPESAKIKVSCKNISKLYCRAIPWDWHDFLKRERNRPESLSAREQTEILRNGKNSINWTEELEIKGDFKSHEYTLNAPFEKLKPGFYFIAISAKSDFSPKKNDLAYTSIWVSNTTLITKEGNGTLSGRTVHAITGEPIANATITAWNRVYGGERSPLPQVKSDKDGKFTIPGAKPGAIILAENPDGNAIDRSPRIYQSFRSKQDEEKFREYKLLFTDRAIYRPGQSIQFKGILAHYKLREVGSETCLPGKKVSVSLIDNNSRALETIDCYSNAFGSFAGTFSLPNKLLPGTYRIAFDNKIMRTISVEEYKRSKFSAQIKAPQDELILGGNAYATISAKTLAGAPLNHAKIEWEVKENQLYRGKKAVAHGTGTLNEKGEFKITFPTKVAKLPKNSEASSASERLIQERQLLSFYNISAKITDNAGETHEFTSTVPVGNVALRIDASLEKPLLTNESEPCVKILTKTHTNAPKSTLLKAELFEILNVPENLETKLNENSKRGKKLSEQQIQTKEDGPSTLKLNKLPAGAYLLVLSGKDKFSKPIEEKLVLRILDENAKKYTLPESFFCEAFLPKNSQAKGYQESQVPFQFDPQSQLSPYTYEIGETYKFIWGSGYESARAYVEILCAGKIINEFWTEPKLTQQKIEIPITQKLAGGFSIRISQIRNNKFQQKTTNIPVIIPNKRFKITWEKFRTKLVPGGAEIWTAKIQDTHGVPVKAEIVASLYDKSLDEFVQNSFPEFRLPSFESGPYDGNFLQCGNLSRWFRKVDSSLWISPYRKSPPFSPLNWTFAQNNLSNLMPIPYRASKLSLARAVPANSLPETAFAAQDKAAGTDSIIPETTEEGILSKSKISPKKQSPQNDEIFAIPRKNFNETAFFYPFLSTNENGIVQISFVVPETLTTWRFLAFAHDEKLRCGSLIASDIVSSKELMVQANPPRFLREGDEIYFPVKISNTGTSPLNGNAKLHFADLESGADLSEKLGVAGTHPFSIPAKSSKTFLWKLKVPENCPFLSYKVIANSEKFSDGEENFLPVLSRKVLLSESQTVPVRANSTKKLELSTLANPPQGIESKTLQITLDSDPKWAALLALPALEKSSQENEASDSLFNRYYANAIASEILNADPTLRQRFEHWKNSNTILSPLEKNEEIKLIALEETPYFQDAKKESKRQRNLGEFFDINKIENESHRALTELKKRLNSCHGNGWSWFPGHENVNSTITRNILIGFARLRELGIPTDMSIPMQAVPAQDKWLGDNYDVFDANGNRTPQDLNSQIAAYLYMRSFYQKEIPQQRKDAWEYYLNQANNKKYWLKLPRMAQGHIALALHKIDGNSNTAKTIAHSILEHATQNDDLGLFWKDEKLTSWWRWDYAPTETQALMLELFEKVTNDSKTVEEIKINLLTRKKTEQWNNTRATADAVWSILANDVKNKKLLVPATKNNQAKITLENQELTLKPCAPASEQKQLVGNEILPKYGKLQVHNPSEKLVFASVNWTFSQNIDEVKKHEQSAIKIRKTLWKRALDKQGTPKLFPARGETLEPGDEIIVRLTIITDRDFEFLHLKDYRGSGTEPSRNRSGHYLKDGVLYYQAIKDTATHFFFDRLPAGTHVFEYPLHIQQRGKYTGGFASLQSLYAPEFNAHSSSSEIQVD